jgi:transposase
LPKPYRLLSLQALKGLGFSEVFYDYAFGKHGKPRFKGKGQFDSVEGKSNVSGIRWKNGAVHWMGLELKAILDESDLVLRHGLTSPVKYVRLVRRKFNQTVRWFAQLVCEGFSYHKPQHTIGSATVGLDIGPSTIAIVSLPTDSSQNRTADLKTFCDKLVRRNKYIRRLQRQMDRSRRATNPDHYNPNGTAKKGKRRWHKSNRYKVVSARKSESERKQAAHRKSLHGQLANQTLAIGRTIKTEKLSYRAFQKMFGRSVSFRAPGSFVSILRRKAANAGGLVYEFDPRPTRLSQTCVCGSIQKKPLSQRVHQCDCGVAVQRDIFSAYLACHVEEGRLKAASVLIDWRNGAENHLRTALSLNQLASDKVRPVHVAKRQSESFVPSAKKQVRVGYRQMSLFDCRTPCL